MSPVPAYPATRHAPPPVVDLSAKAERERLSPSAIKAFLNIMGKWDVRDEDARALLGGMSNGQFYDMKKKPERTLPADTLSRISYLIGIFKALGMTKRLSERWASANERYLKENIRATDVNPNLGSGAKVPTKKG